MKAVLALLVLAAHPLKPGAPKEPGKELEALIDLMAGIQEGDPGYMSSMSGSTFSPLVESLVPYHSPPVDEPVFALFKLPGKGTCADNSDDHFAVSVMKCFGGRAPAQEFKEHCLQRIPQSK